MNDIATSTATKATRKSANPKVNSKTVDPSIKARVERRKLNTNVVVEHGVPIPEKEAKSKYPFRDLKYKGDTFLLADVTDGNAAAIKSAARTKFGIKLISRRPEGDKTAMRFWRVDGPERPAPDAEGEAANESETA